MVQLTMALTVNRTDNGAINSIIIDTKQIDGIVGCLVANGVNDASNGRDTDTMSRWCLNIWCYHGDIQPIGYECE